MSDRAYDRKLNLRSVDRPGLLGELLDGRYRKPGSITDQAFLQSKAAILYNGATIARAVAGGGAPPFGIDTNKFGVFNKNSNEPIYIAKIELIDNGDNTFDALFPVYEKKTDKTFWMRVAQAQATIDDANQDLEVPLKSLLRQVGGEPPEPPEPLNPGPPSSGEPRKFPVAHDVTGLASLSEDAARNGRVRS